MLHFMRLRVSIIKELVWVAMPEMPSAVYFGDKGKV